MPQLNAWSFALPLRQPLRSWLRSTGSLSARLEASGRSFGVRLLRQCHGALSIDESQRLWREAPQTHAERAARPRDAHVREVLLMLDEVPVVFARSVLPMAQARGPWQALRGLGTRPLADVLFGDPRVRRSTLRFARLSRGHPLYKSAVTWRLAPLCTRPPAGLWVRESVFIKHRSPLLVTEVFLPAIESVPAPRRR